MSHLLRFRFLPAVILIVTLLAGTLLTQPLRPGTSPALLMNRSMALPSGSGLSQDPPPPVPPSGENPDGTIGTRYPNGVVVKWDDGHDVSPPLRELAKLDTGAAPGGPILHYMPPDYSRLPQQLPVGTILPDPFLQRTYGPNSIPALTVNFNGIDNRNNPPLHGGYIYQPPDTDGDVGPNHYFEWVNNAYAVYSKSGTLLLGPAAGSTIWSGFSGPAVCTSTDRGDPIVIYDSIADRWMISQFAFTTTGGGTFKDSATECIAVSTTPDPTGTWYRYGWTFSNSIFYDYPHGGVWPDGYYFNFNRFNGNFWGGDAVVAFQRSAMLAGAPAAAQQFVIPASPGTHGSLLPSDFDGTYLPPLGAPNYFMDALTVAGANTLISLWKFHVDWATPGNSTFGINGGAYDPNYNLASSYNMLCPATSRQTCIPSPAGNLESLGDRMMWRLAYRNYRGYESLVSNFTVDAGSSRAGLRWFEVRNLATTPSIYQQGTYAPADTQHRWTGSIAEDRMGNMALSFSSSRNAAGNPKIAYTGRLVTETLGSMLQGEAIVLSSDGQQTGGARWGDYANISIDPNDDCTFWFVNEYLLDSGTSYDWSEWATRIGAFKYPSCVPPPLCFSDTADSFTNFNHTANTAANDTWAVFAAGGAQGNVFRVQDTAAGSSKSLFLGQAIPVGTAADGTTLSFQHKYNFGADDGGRVEASIDGGLNWVEINSGVTNNVFSMGQPLTKTITGVGNPLNGLTGWTGTNSYFATVKINLSLQFAGQNVLIRWLYGAGNTVSAGTDWQIDNVQVENCASGRDLVSGFLYADCNNNLTRETAFNEAGISGVTMALNGDASGTTTTNAQGYWQFSTAPAGSNYSVYAVGTTLPNGGGTTAGAPAAWNAASNGGRCTGTGWTTGSTTFWSWGENGGLVSFTGIRPGAPDGMVANSRIGVRGDGASPTAVDMARAQVTAAGGTLAPLALAVLVTLGLVLAWRRR
jgi:hypothetical protein